MLPVTDDTPQELAEIAKSEILAANAVVLDAQLEERPLAKMQEKVQEEEDAKEDAAEAESRASSVNGDAEPATNGNGVEVTRTPTPTREKHHRKALLKNTDTELVRVQRVSKACCYSRIPSDQTIVSYWKKFTGNTTLPSTSDQQKRNRSPRSPPDGENPIRYPTMSGYVKLRSRYTSQSELS